MAEAVKNKYAKKTKKKKEKTIDDISDSVPLPPTLEDFCDTFVESTKIESEEVLNQKEDEKTENQDIDEDVEDSVSQSDQTKTMEENDDVIVTNLNTIDNILIEEPCDVVTQDVIDIDIKTVEVENKVTTYEELASEVSECLKQISPTAPQLEIPETESVEPEQEYLDIVQQQASSAAAQSGQNVSVNKSVKIISLQSKLKPFDKKQLKEFYVNKELETCEHVIDEFLEYELRNKGKPQHVLYELLKKYLKSKINLDSNKVELNRLEKNLDSNVKNLWSVWKNVELNSDGLCMDSNRVSACHFYQHAKLEDNVFTELGDTLGEIKKIVHECQSFDMFCNQVAKAQIQNYLDNVMLSCPEFTQLAQNSQPDINLTQTNLYFQQCLFNLRTCIGILFIFQRKQVKDVEFLNDTKQWLTQLLAILMRVGTYRDHIYILCQLLRCPAGVGEWGAKFIQTPNKFSDYKHDTSFDDPYLNHIVTVLSIVLMPIKKRELFFENLEFINEEEVWVVVDSDGEDDDNDVCMLKENDLVAFVNQIPFTDLFKNVLQFKKRDNQLVLTGDVSSTYVLKLFSFCDCILTIIHTGITHYNKNKYKQFCKRLGSLARHVVQYCSEIFQVYQQQVIYDPMLIRVQVEYDELVYKATKYIHSCKKLGTWQFLAIMPFNIISENILWRIYFLLTTQTDVSSHTDDDLDVTPEFEELFNTLNEEEQFYLLSTLSSMAIARDETQIKFITTITNNIFYIGFLSDTTRENSYKNCRNILINLTTKFPFVVSNLLIKQYEYFNVKNYSQSLMLYLWNELPCLRWIPTVDDMKILCDCLIKEPNTIESEFARTIISSLNYDVTDHALFLPFRIHQQVAFIIMKVGEKYVPDTEAYPLINGVKNVSSLATSVIRQSSCEQNLLQWCWSVILKLKLHMTDQSEYSVYNSFKDLTNVFKYIPDIDNISELRESIDKKQSLACYVGLMVTTLGHSVPIICNQGFKQLDILVNNYKYDAAIMCIECMTPMFLECHDSLYKSDKFLHIVTQILTADYTYLKMAKNLIMTERPGPILTTFTQMLQNQIFNYKKYGLNHFNTIIELWLNVLTSINLWSQEPAVLSAVDVLIENSFFDSRSRTSCIKIVQSLLRNSSETRSSIASFMSWVGSNTTQPFLLPRGYNGNTPWLAYFVLEIEFEQFEEKTNLYNELLRELVQGSSKKTNIDASLKKVCNHLDIPVRTSNCLSIYRWCYQVLETEISHPLTILIWQKFFSLFLRKVPGVVDKGSVGDKFFHGMVNLTLLKRLKKRLQESADFYINLSENEEDIKKELYVKCLKLFQTFLLWLEEPRLHEPGLFLAALPAQCNPHLLAVLMQGNDGPWLEFICYQDIINKQHKMVDSWNVTKQRGKTQTSGTPQREEKSPLERMIDRFETYEKPQPPPTLKKVSQTLPTIQRDTLLRSGEVITYIKPFTKVLLEYAQNCTTNVNEHTAMDCNLLELVPNLYTFKEQEVTLKVHCDGFTKTVDNHSMRFACSGPACITFKYSNATTDHRCKEQIGHILCEYTNIIKKCKLPISTNIINSTVFLNNFIEKLEKEYELAKKYGESHVQLLENTGVSLFYYFVRNFNEEIAYLQSTKQFFSSSIEKLGCLFINENEKECLTLLDKIIESPSSTLLLGPHLTPNASNLQNFINMYTSIVDYSAGQSPEYTFVVLSKFDIARWITERKPRYSDRSQLIDQIGRGLHAGGLNPSELKAMVHELYSNHLKTILLHDFPEHYGEILNLLLKSSETQSISIEVWFNFLNTLLPSSCRFLPGINTEKVFQPASSVRRLKEIFVKFATELKNLDYQDIKDTVVLLGDHFKKERLQFGLYGLYPKYRPYIEPLSLLFGMMSHAFIVKTLQQDGGSLSEKLCDQIWPVLCDLYSPWIAPYWTKNIKNSAASWIQELTDDKTLILPWIQNDSIYALFVTSIFIESVKFIIETIPGCSNMLSCVWNLYATCYAHAQVKEHIYSVIHPCFLQLPWSKCTPTLTDVETMLKITDQFLPIAHSFLSNIFIEIDWKSLVYDWLQTRTTEVNTRIHVCLLNLLVKLPYEPTLKQNDKVLKVVIDSYEYGWHLVEANSYDKVLDWYVMSCDPRILLIDKNSEECQLDSTILGLLQVSAGYHETVQYFHPTTLLKRQMFVRACVRTIITANSRYKYLLAKHKYMYNTAVCKILTDMENTVTATVPVPQRVQEAGVLLSEFLVCLKQTDLCPVIEESVIHWLSTRCAGVVVRGMFRVGGLSIQDAQVFGSLMEACLTSYFTSNENSTWSEVLTTLQPCSCVHPPLEDVLISTGRLLTLYSLLMKRLIHCTDLREERLVLVSLIDLLPAVKTSEVTEPKLPLLWGQCLKLIERQAGSNNKEAILQLRRLVHCLKATANEKGGGLLSAIGLWKSYTPTSKCKLICLSVESSIWNVIHQINISKNTSDSTNDVLEEVARSRLVLEQLESNRQFSDIKEYVIFARSQSRNIKTLTDLVHYFHDITTKLYQESYLKQY